MPDEPEVGGPVGAEDVPPTDPLEVDPGIEVELADIDVSAFPETAEQELMRESIEADRKATAASYMRAFNRKYEEMSHAKKAAIEASEALGPYKDIIEFAQNDERFRDHMSSALKAYESELSGEPPATPLEDTPPATYEDVDPSVVEFLDKYLGEYIKTKGLVRQDEITDLKDFIATGRAASVEAGLRDNLAEGGLLSMYDELSSAGRIDAEIDAQRLLGNVATREDAFWKIAGKEGLLAAHAKAVVTGEVQLKIDATVPESEAIGTRKTSEVDMSEMSAKEMEAHLPQAPGAEDVKTPYE